MKRAYKKFIQETIKRVKHPLFPALILALAFLDHFVFVIPIDGLLCVSVILNPLLWKRKAVAVSVGSALGAFALAVIVRLYGIDVFTSYFPEVVSSNYWSWSMELLEKWGTLGLFMVMVSPFMQQPAVCLIAVGQTPLSVIFGVILAGKGVKYLIMTWVASKFPHILHRLKFISGELDELGTVIQKENDSREKQ